MTSNKKKNIDLGEESIALYLKKASVESAPRPQS